MDIRDQSEENDINLFSNEHKPFLQRTSTFIMFIVLCLVAVVGFAIYLTSVKITANLAKESAEATVIESICESTWRIQKWSAERKYNRSSVPQCAWGVDPDSWEVCDEYEQVCAARDSTGTCIRTESTTNCIRSHTETDYDYNLMEWKSFKELKHITYDGDLTKDKRLDYFDDPRKYEVTVSRYYYVTVFSHGEKKRFRVDKAKYILTKKGDVVLIERRKKSKKIINLQ